MTWIRGAILERAGAERPWTATEPIRVDLVELAEPGPGEVEIRMEAAGVCHSDLARVEGTREAPLPLLLGHEGSGTVVRLGPGVDSVAVGDRVATVFLPRCGECETCCAPGWSLCDRGTAASRNGEMLRGGHRLRWRGAAVNHQSGISAFATRVVVDAASVVPVPSVLPPAIAAILGCAVLTGGGAVLNAGALRQGESVAVIGLGGVGFAAALVAAASGAGELVAIDRLPAKLAEAGGFGADEALVPEQALARRSRFDLVVDCTGNVGALDMAMRLTRPGGRTVTVGLPPPTAELKVSPLSLVTEARSLIGSYLGSGDPAADIDRYAAMYQAGSLDLDRLITGYVKLDEINHAMDALHEGTVLRQIVDLAAEEDSR
jgi:alcohol dehydrogenase